MEKFFFCLHALFWNVISLDYNHLWIDDYSEQKTMASNAKLWAKMYEKQ